MFDLRIYLQMLNVMIVLALVAWSLSVVKKDVGIVDSFWSLFFVFSAAIAYELTPEPGARAGIVFLLVLLWGVRLSAYVTWRNHGKPEDHRYQAIRARNQPRFEVKSLYLVFLLQAGIAWVVSLPLLAAIRGNAPLGIIDFLGIGLVMVGFLFESIGDHQLARFKRKPENRGKVMDRGLWRFTRHPNYFGDFCVWWGFFLLALGAGGWWALLSPLVMSVLLLKVSGVALLEKDISDRRPGYARYAKSTNAFFPWFPRQTN